MQQANKPTARQEGGRWLQGLEKPLEQNGQPLVTIITVVYNSAEHLAQAMESVLNQTYPLVEYIVIDGGSTDGSLDIIKRYESQLDYWISERDKGIYDAMNKGVALARGAWIGFKNADDWFVPEAVSLASQLFAQQPAVIYGNTLKVWQQQPFEASLLTSNHHDLPWRSCVDHRSAFLRADLHKARPYDLRFRLAADYDLMLEWLQQGHLFMHTGQVHGCMRFGGASDRSSIYREIFDIQKKYNFRAALFCFLQNHARFYKLLIQNKILQAALGQQGYKRFKARGLRKSG